MAVDTPDHAPTPPNDHHKSGWDYRTTFAVIPEDFPTNHQDLSRQLGSISPKPPRGDAWQLVSSTSITRPNGEQVVLYFWERPSTLRTFPSALS